MNFDTARPIYRQIIDDFKKKMIRGELKQGDKILSQREYAQAASINPNTVQRAYREMESMNLVETLRGQGTFISVTEESLRNIKDTMVQDLLDTFISEIRSLGYSDQEIHEMLNQQMKDGEK